MEFQCIGAVIVFSLVSLCSRLIPFLFVVVASCVVLVCVWGRRLYCIVLFLFVEVLACCVVLDWCLFFLYFLLCGGLCVCVRSGAHCGIVWVSGPMDVVFLFSIIF